MPLTAAVDGVSRIRADLSTACGRRRTNDRLKRAGRCLGNPVLAAQAAPGFLYGPTSWTIRTTSTPARARRHPAQPVQRALRGAVPHLELRVRQRGAGRGALRERGGRLRLLALHQPDGRRCSRNALAALEGAEACVATASGMSAILATAMVLAEGRRPRGLRRRACSARRCSSSPRSSRASASRRRLSTAPIAEAWRRAIRPTTRLLFLETPSNPLTEIADIAALAGLAKQRGRAARGRQLLLHAGAAAAARARRRPGDPLGDQVPRRAGQGARRRGARPARAGAGRRSSAFLRTAGPSAVAVQRLGAAEGTRDAEAAHARAVGARRSSSRAGSSGTRGSSASTTPGSSRTRSTRSRGASSARAGRSSRST